MPATKSQSRLAAWGFPEGVRPARETLLVGAVLTPLIVFVYRLWDAHWRVPFNYGGDALTNAAYTKGIIENGWYLSNPRLGAPFTADLRDFPLGGENAHWLAFKILGLLTGNYATTLNLYFVLSFFAIALVAYFVVRYLGFGVATACVVATLYAFLPYHAFRNIAHISRAAYYPVPLAALVIVWLTRYRDDFLRADGDRWRVRRGRLAFAIAVAVLLGCTDDQNTAYLASIMAVLALVLALRDRDWRPLALAAVISVVGFGVLSVNNAPYLVSRLERGPNTMVAQRSLTDQDYYALRPVNLLLPAPGHRIGALASIANTSANAQTTNNEAPGTSLGFVGAAGLLWSTGAALAVALGVRTRRRSTEFVAQLGVVNLIAILIGMFGGLSFLIALAGFRTYRSWNRISVYIAFLSLLAVAAGLDRLFGYLRERGRRRHLGTTLVAGTLAVIVLVGVLDQTTPGLIPNYKALATAFDTDARFYQAVESSVPAHSMVFQLPIAPFPEVGTIQKMPDYEEFDAYLQTKTLRWSYGAMRGRIESDWQENVNIDDPVGLLAQVAAVGFVGVVIDRDGIAGGASKLLAAVLPYVGAPQIGSTDGNLVYLDLRGLHARLETELGPNAITQSSDVVVGNTVRWTDFYTPDTICNGSNRWSATRTSSVELNNLSPAPVSVDASTGLVANRAATQIEVRVQASDDTIKLSGGTGSWSRHLVLPPGKTRIQFTLVGPNFVAPGDTRHLYFALNRYSFGGAFDSPVQAWAAQQLPICKP